MLFSSTVDQVTRRRVAFLVWLGLIALLLGGCGIKNLSLPASSSTPTGQTGLQFAPAYSLSRAYPSAEVRFRPAVTYLAALQAVTDLGLQPLSSCLGAAGSQTPWKSTSQESSFDSQDGRGDLQVTVTPLTPADWLQRLIAASSVTLVYDGPIYCPNISGDLTPIPGRLYFLGYNAQTVYLRVTFSEASQTSYLQRLEAISNLGFRLADPCFEKQQPHGAWHAVSQQSSFATSGQFVLATTEANSPAWLSQLRATDGVTQVAAPYTPAC